MKTRLSLVVGALVAGVVWSGSAQAVQPFPTVTRDFNAWMVRAYDQCMPGMMSVVGSGLPGSGCLAVNTTTDSTITMNSAKIAVRKITGKVAMFGFGFQAGARVKVQLTLRVTKFGQTVKHPPGTNKFVTFADTTVQCGTTPFGFVANARGTIAASVSLSTCLGPNFGLATGNIEIIDAALVNNDTGLVFAHPGILH
ncbi:MAG: hypothetical protein HY270_12035 [Deltaproteobacteria bacterium]|nr:hypothetical protein [Deltaproteobacteria bacterium]